MTGDGVNDAPALKKQIDCDGNIRNRCCRGSERYDPYDDNFASIVNAVEE